MKVINIIMWILICMDTLLVIVGEAFCDVQFPMELTGLIVLGWLLMLAWGKP